MISHRWLFLPVVLLASQARGIVGSWHGTSTCVNRERHPACNNENVIYDVTPVGTRGDSITLRADKVVNGVRDFMGEFGFNHRADGSWVAEIARYHSRIVLRVTGDSMVGSLTDVAAGDQVRALALTRSR